MNTTDNNFISTTLGVEWKCISLFISFFLFVCICYTYLNITEKRENRQVIIKKETIPSDHDELLQNIDPYEENKETILVEMATI